MKNMIKLFCSKCFDYKVFKDVGYFECTTCGFDLHYDEISYKTEIANEVNEIE